MMWGEGGRAGAGKPRRNEPPKRNRDGTKRTGTRNRTEPKTEAGTEGRGKGKGKGTVEGTEQNETEQGNTRKRKSESTESIAP